MGINRNADIREGGKKARIIEIQFLLFFSIFFTPHFLLPMEYIKGGGITMLFCKMKNLVWKFRFTHIRGVKSKFTSNLVKGKLKGLSSIHCFREELKAGCIFCNKLINILEIVEFWHRRRRMRREMQSFSLLFFAQKAHLPSVRWIVHVLSVDKKPHGNW